MVIRAAITDFWESKIFSIQGSSNWKNHNKNTQKTTIKKQPPQTAKKRSNPPKLTLKCLRVWSFLHTGIT